MFIVDGTSQDMCFLSRRRSKKMRHTRHRRGRSGSASHQRGRSATWGNLARQGDNALYA